MRPGLARRARAPTRTSLRSSPDRRRIAQRSAMRSSKRSTHCSAAGRSQQHPVHSRPCTHARQALLRAQTFAPQRLLRTPVLIPRMHEHNRSKPQVIGQVDASTPMVQTESNDRMKSKECALNEIRRRSATVGITHENNVQRICRLGVQVAGAR